MVLGRISNARRIQEVCIFCSLHAEANLSRTSRRLHLGRSNRKAAEATAAQKVEDSDAPDLISTGYSSHNARSKPAISGDHKSVGGSLYGARYTDKQAPSWKRQDTTKTEGRWSESDSVTSERDSQVSPLNRPVRIRTYVTKNDERNHTQQSQDNSQRTWSKGFVRLPRVHAKEGQLQEAQQVSKNETAEILLQSRSSALSQQPQNPEWKPKLNKSSLQQMLEHSPREEPERQQAHLTFHSDGKSQESLRSNRSQHTVSAKDAGNSSQNKESNHDSVSVAQPQPRQDNVRWTQLAPRIEKASNSNASDASVPRFMPLEKSPTPRPGRTISGSSNIVPPASEILPKSEPSGFVGFRSDRDSWQNYTPKTTTPDSSSVPKSSIESSSREPETPSRPKERRRNNLWAEEDDTRSDGKRLKAKKSKPARRRSDDENEDDIDPQLLEKIEEKQRRKAAAKAAREDRASGQSFIVPSFISIGNLATALKIRAESFGEVLRRQGFEKLSNDHVLDAETAGLIATELGFKAILPIKDSEIDILAQPAPESTDLLPPRPPVVTIMGHVDHGKTTLLDWLRNSSIAASEHGGITQHIGAFTVQMPSGRIITFLDTPGHAAFLEMRARGANVTDIVILVVAADDSVKPQTIEAIRHAKAAHTQIVVAISKIDKPEADADRVKQDLARHGIEVEDYGGDTQTVSVSGKTGQGMDQLEDAIIALADVLDMKADPSGSVEGWVLEGARKSSGKTATVLIRRGTMKPGQIIVAGHTWARIRNLRNEAGVNIEEGLPGTPVEIDGWHEQPEAGAEVLQAPNEQRARRVVDYRIGKAEIEKQAAEVAAVNEARRLHDKQRELEKDRIALLGKKAAQLQAVTPEPVKSGMTEVPIIIRADVSGSAEAVNDSILALGNSEVRAKVIRTMVGRVSESDIELAVATEGYIVNFNVELDSDILRLADRAGVRIVDGSIIYKVMDDVKAVLEEKLPPRLTQHVTGEADVLQTFEINLKGKKTLPVAGCRIKNGLIAKGSRVKVIREEDIVYDGLLSTLKHLKKDVTEMRKGSECGISFDNFSDFAPGDQIQCYEVKSEKRHL